MFWYGKNNHFVGPDWRPEIHDSDGLEMALGSGERIWRPLNNPPRVMANSFRADGLRGFGLAQRERSFEEYQDDGVFYEKRATLWVEPQGDWGAGSVMLVELPTNDEIHDNIVRLLEPGGAGGGGQRLRPRLQAELGRGLAAADGGAVHRDPDRRGRRAGPAAAGEPGASSSATSTARGSRGSTARAGSRRWSRRAGASSTWSRLPDRDHRPLAGDLRPRHRPAGAGGRRRSTSGCILSHEGRGDVGDLALPGVPVAAARAARAAPLRALRMPVRKLRTMVIILSCKKFRVGVNEGGNLR